jgi:hypothetical protein
MSGNPKTSADLVFEEYLKAHGHPDFEYERQLPGTNRVPDYQIPWTPQPLLFEVKGFEVPVTIGFGAVDPYPPLREKITQATKQFKDVEDHTCSLVLHYAGPGLIFLEPDFILGAMLGNIGFEIPIQHYGNTALSFDEKNISNVFTSGGRMIRYARSGEPIAPQNTTISAVIVVEHFNLGQRRFNKHYETLERALGRTLTTDELFAEMQAARGTNRDVTLRAVRAVVCENPYARLPLPRELFAGPYDERYGSDDGAHILRVYAGPVVLELEQA